MSNNKEYFNKASEAASQNFTYADGTLPTAAPNFLGTIKAHVFTFTGGIAVGMIAMYLIKKLS